jgi:transcriptional regulator with XRE-family HTH domain
MQTTRSQPVGLLLRSWRQRRRLSQLELALEAEISPRHLSFLETGRSRPSRDTLLRLARQLQVPLREQNALLLAAGYAPAFLERPLAAPEMEAARHTVELVLAGHEPAPAIAIDRHWTLLAANRMVAPLLADLDQGLLQPPVNVIRLALHPRGLAAQVENLAEWRAHLLARLRQQVALSGDPVLSDLWHEVAAFPAPAGRGPQHAPAPHTTAPLAIVLRARTAAGPLALLSTTTVFGTPVDITLAEIAIESFFPADAATAEALRTFWAGLPPAGAGGGGQAGR